MFNKVVLAGYVGTVNEARSFKRDDGTESNLTSFSLAVNRPGLENPDWFQIQAWNGLATEVVNKYVETGRFLLIEGEVRPYTYNKKVELDVDGSIIEAEIPMNGMNIRAESIRFLDKKQEGGNSSKTVKGTVKAKAKQTAKPAKKASGSNYTPPEEDYPF